MRKVQLITMICLFSFISISSAQSQEKRYVFDLNKSILKWVVDQGEDKLTGTLKLKEGGYIVMKDNELNQVVVFTDVKSIKCTKCGNSDDSKKLIEFIKSTDFLDVLNMEYASFKMFEQKELIDSKDGNFFIEGNLTIKGYSNKVSFPTFVKVKDDKIFASGAIPLNRMLWNLKDPVNEQGQLIHQTEGMTRLYFYLEGIETK